MYLGSMMKKLDIKVKRGKRGVGERGLQKGERERNK